MARVRTGERNLRIVICPRVLAAQSANGEEGESWPVPASGGEYFAARMTLSGSEQIVQGLRQSEGGMKLSIKGRSIPVKAYDRVQNKYTGEVFHVTGVMRDTAETVLLVERVVQQTVNQEGGQ